MKSTSVLCLVVVSLFAFSSSAPLLEAAVPRSKRQVSRRPGPYDQPKARPGAVNGQPNTRQGTFGQPATRPGAYNGQPSARPGRPGDINGQPAGRPVTFNGQRATRPGGFNGQPATRPGQPVGRPGAFNGQPAGRPGTFNGQPATRPGTSNNQPVARPGVQPKPGTRPGKIKKPIVGQITPTGCQQGFVEDFNGNCRRVVDANSNGNPKPQDSQDYF